ncbi:PE domain-containing protein [Mycobacterium lacus]|uniref:PE domain-containing protein n=1 Tax=Mycobacterium lacus TaxID=169765 RepID=UPI00111BD464|nr:PE domain-containing protein [Mycobacterium lacus]MCV7123264.1 PE domain-containing protein [Mycobacterium lacus]
MSFVMTHPPGLAAAASALDGVGSALAAHELLVTVVNTSAGSYAATEAANATSASKQGDRR